VIDDNPFFTFDKVEEEKEIPPEVESVKKTKKEKPIPKPFSGVMPEKIIVHRSIDKDGNISTAWADKSTLHPDALHYYSKYLEFY
jgi:hypothetical protein